MCASSYSDLQKRGRTSKPTAKLYDFLTRQAANNRLLRIRQLKRENALLSRELLTIRAEIERLQDACRNGRAAGICSDSDRSLRRAR